MVYNWNIDYFTNQLSEPLSTPWDRTDFGFSILMHLALDVGYYTSLCHCCPNLYVPTM